MARLFIVLLTVLITVHPRTALFAQTSNLLRKTNWTVEEVKDWALKYKSMQKNGLLLYQGSDSLYHHFITRVVDEWVWFNIRRAELSIDDERPYKTTTSSSSSSKYYYVDPTRDFIKVKDY